MPEYSHEDLEPWKSVWVHLPGAAALAAFSAAIKQPLGEKTRYVHFPPVEPLKVAHLQ